MIPGRTKTIGWSAPARVCIERSIGTGSSSSAGDLVEGWRPLSGRRRKPVDERGARARIAEVVEVADVAALVEDVARQVTAGPVKHGVGVDDEVVVASLVDDVIAGEHAEALEPVAALDVARDHAHRADRRSLAGCSAARPAATAGSSLRVRAPATARSGSG